MSLPNKTKSESYPELLIVNAADRWRKRFCSYPGRSHGHGKSNDRTWSKDCCENVAMSTPLTIAIAAKRYTALRRAEFKDTESEKFTESEQKAENRGRMPAGCSGRDRHGMPKGNRKRPSP